MLLDYKVPAYIRAPFVAEVKRISALLGCAPELLMLLMNSESGINPAAYNKNGGATGLIQFMPSTAKGLGTTTVNLKAMNHLVQLQYVYKYFKPYSGRLKSFHDLYLVTFFPVAIGKADDWIFHTDHLSAKSIALANPGIAKYGPAPKEYITVDAFKKYTSAKLAQFKDYLPAATDSGSSPAILPIVIGLAVGVVFALAAMR